ncbi:MAG: alpha/beta hydrolase [Pseudomonadales bacterium]|nr:alpha/beta hydrolase [Pseudomonadales bacterium]
MSYTESEHTYLVRDNHPFRGVFYQPAPEQRSYSGIVIDIHGGAWSSGHRKSGRHYCRFLASQGIPVFAIDFRQGPDHKHPASVEDIHAAIQWVADPDSLGISIESIDLTGSSSGGHLAMVAALNPPADQPRIRRVVALWPVSNPLARYHYVTQRVNEPRETWIDVYPDRLVAGHEAYFDSMQQMSEAAVQHILLAGQFSHLPALFIVQPELDQNAPVFLNQTLSGAWLRAGGEVTYKLYPGVGHGFAHREGDQTDICLADMATFIGFP